MNNKWSLLIIFCLATNFINCQGLFNTTAGSDEDFLSKYSSSNLIKVTPSFIQEFDNNLPECLSSMKNVLGLLSDYEQAIIVLSAKKNANTDRCLDCAIYSELLPEAYEKQMRALSQLISSERKGRKETFNCLLDMGSLSSDSKLNSYLRNNVINNLYTHGASNKCFVQFLSDYGQILFQRRRFFCAKMEDMNAMAIKSSTGEITGFKWTEEEAKLMTDAFLKLSQCINKERYSIPQTFINSVSSMLTSPQCNKNLELASTVDTSPADSNRTVIISNTNGSNNSADSSDSGLRFLQEVVSSLPLEADFTDLNVPNANISPLETPSDPIVEETSTNEASTNTVDASPPSTPVEAAEVQPLISPALTNETILEPSVLTNSTLVTEESFANENESIPSTSNIVVEDENASINSDAPVVIPIIEFPVNNETETNITATVLFDSTINNTTLPSLNSNNTNSSGLELILENYPALDISSKLSNPLMNLKDLSSIKYLEVSLDVNLANNKILISNFMDYAKGESDLHNSINFFIDNLMNSTSQLNKDLSNDIKQKLLKNYNFNCQPAGIIHFLSNVKDNLNLMREFESSSCEESDNYSLIIKDDSITCENCSTNLAQQQINFIDDSIAHKYYLFSSICINKRKVKFGYWIDQVGIPYTFYEDGTLNLNERCIKKAFDCSVESNSDKFCPNHLLKEMCLTELESKCRQTKLFNLIEKLRYNNRFNFKLPKECDPSVSNSEFKSKCFI